VDLPSSTASASKHFADNLCALHELHEYDQDEDSSNLQIPLVLLLHNVVTFRKVLLVVIEQLGGLSGEGDMWLFS